jgi:hypothetical protein
MADIFKMAADKIGKISEFSDFNENWYLGLLWSEELIGNDNNFIICLWEFGRTSSPGEEEEEE